LKDVKNKHNSDVLILKITHYALNAYVFED